MLDEVALGLTRNSQLLTADPMECRSLGMLKLACDLYKFAAVVVVDAVTQLTVVIFSHYAPRLRESRSV